MKYLFVLFLLIANINASSRVIKIYTNLDNKPYAFYDNGDVIGIYVDIIKEAMRRVGKYDVVFADTTSKRGVQRLYNNEILTYMSSISKESEDYKEMLYNMERINIEYKNINYSIIFSQKPFLYKKDFTSNFNLALKIMKNSGKIDEIIEEYSSEGAKKVIPIALYDWSFMVSKELGGYGFYAELIKEVWAEAGYNVKIDVVSPHYANLLTKWAKVFQSAPSLKEDKKLKFFYFSDPIMAMPINIFYKKSDFPKGIDENELRGYKIGAISRYYYDKILINHRLNIKYFDSEDELFKALVGSNVDMIIAEKYLFKENILKHDKDSTSYKMVTKDISNGSFIYMIFAKNYYNSNTLKDKFNKGFKSLKESGKLNALLQKYTLDDDFYNDTFGKVEGKIKVKEKNVFIFGEDD